MSWKDRARKLGGDAPPLDTSTAVREPDGAVAAPELAGSWRDRAARVDSSPEPSSDSTPGMGEAFARGAGQGLTLGFGDELAGGVQALGQRFLPESMGGGSAEEKARGIGELYRENRDTFRREDDAAEKAHPVASLAGNLTGGAIGNALIPELKAAKGAGLLAKLGYHALNGALQGGAYAAGASKADDAGGVAADTALGAGMGGVLAPAIAGAGKVLGKVTAPISDAVRGWAEERAAKMGVPMLRDFRAVAGKAGAGEAEQKIRDVGRKLLDTGAVGFGDNYQNVAEKLAPIRDEAGKAVGDAVERLDQATRGDWAVDGRNVAKRIQQEVLVPLQQAPINRGIVKRIATEAQGIFEKGPMSFEDAENLKRAIDKHINYYSQAKNPMADGLRALRYVLSDEVEKQAERVDPRLADEFLAAKQHFGMVAPAEDAATDRHLRDLANRQISPSDYAAMIAGAAHGGPAGILAAGAHHVARTRGAASLAVTGDAVANLLRSAPEKLGDYAPVLARAAARSPEALRAMAAVLAQRDPKFNETVQAAQQ